MIDNIKRFINHKIMNRKIFNWALLSIFAILFLIVGIYVRSCPDISSILFTVFGALLGKIITIPENTDVTVSVNPTSSRLISSFHESVIDKINDIDNHAHGDWKPTVFHYKTTFKDICESQLSEASTIKRISDDFDSIEKWSYYYNILGLKQKKSVINKLKSQYSDDFKLFKKFVFNCSDYNKNCFGRYNKYIKHSKKVFHF